jgi:hypothetical protein
MIRSSRLCVAVICTNKILLELFILLNTAPLLWYLVKSMIMNCLVQVEENIQNYQHLLTVVIWNMNLITLLPTVLSVAQSSTFEYFPLYLCLVWYTQMSSQTGIRWSDVIISFVSYKSCYPVALNLGLECPHFVLRKHFKQLEMSAKCSEKSNRIVT